MPRLYANRASTTLVGNISDSATSWTVADGSFFPAPTFGNVAVVTIEQAATFERVLLTARSGNTFTVTRGADGTTAAAFTEGATVVLRPTASMAHNTNLTISRPIPLGYYFYPGVFTWVVGTTTTVPVNGQMNCFPILIPRRGTIDRMGLTVTTRDTVNTDAVLRFGLYSYDEATDQPGVLIADAGTVTAYNAAAGSVDAEVTTSIAVEAGWYVAAVARQGTANVAAVRSISSTGAMSLSSPANTSLASLGVQRGMWRYSATGALPSTPGSLVGTVDGTLPIYIRLS